MLPDSRQTIHIGINYVLAPAPLLDKERHLAFQQVLTSRGIDYSTTTFDNNVSRIIREVPTQFQIKVAPILGSPVGQLLILAPGAWPGLSAVIKEIEAVIDAFSQTWPMEHRQILSVDAAIRDLYETSAEHAFKELWEGRLGQPESALSSLGGPVLGGGLRFVVPQMGPTGEIDCNIEVKIESFLRNTHKIFVETQFTWPLPQPFGPSFSAGEHLRQVNQYIEDRLTAFIMGDLK